MGYAVMGTATARGDRRAVEAAQAARAKPPARSDNLDPAR